MNLHETISYMNMGLPEDILRRKLHGDFDGAIRLIDRRLARTDTPQALRYCLTAHRESLLRLPENYPYTREEAMAKLCSHVPGFTDQEFDDWVDSGKLGWIYSGGEPRYFNRFFETMCKTEPAFALRAGVRLAGGESAGSGSREEGRLDRCVRMMTEQGQMSLRIRIRASLRVKDGRFVPGMFIRAHLPIPAACEQQRDIRIEEIYPAGGQLSPEDDHGGEPRILCCLLLHPHRPVPGRLPAPGGPAAARFRHRGAAAPHRLHPLHPGPGPGTDPGDGGPHGEGPQVL